ncbi:MAG: pyridoxamine 5'-phosphate oxidase family protein [Acidimicrobiia bacterium]
MTPRSSEARKADTLATLASEKDVWVATADPTGQAHLVPLSLWWDGETVTVTTTATAPTARNAAASGRARIAVGTTRDVVMIDGPIELVPLADAPEVVRTGFLDHCGWDPAWNDGEWVYLRLRPQRVQAWRETDEIDGRTLMRDGRWLV